MHLEAVPLSAEAFLPFGRVVSASGPSRPCNDGRATRFFGQGALTHDERATQPELSIYRVVPSTLPLGVTYLERHPGSSQLFMPTRGGRYLVVVAPTRADGSPDVTSLRAFLCEPGEGVVYAPGVWHYPIVALDEETDFLMFIWEAGDDYDCEVRELGVEVTVTP